MRRATIVVFSLVLLLASAGWADEWSKTYKIGGKPDLRVTTTDANITVDTWDQNTIEARVTTRNYKIGEGGLIIHESQNGDAVELELRFPHEHFGLSFHGNRQVEISIHMPRQGQVNLHTGDGSIHLANLKGSMELESGDGNLELDAVDGTLRAHTGDGHIRAQGRFDGLEVRTGDGRVETRADAGSSLGSGWEVETGDGSVVLAIPANLAADVELQSGDGHINLDIPLTVEGNLKENHLRGKMNGGGPLLRVHTGDGSIELKSASM
jgi:DUF4097 and DUF4098 domain-containing protein YvlB